MLLKISLHRVEIVDRPDNGTLTVCNGGIQAMVLGDLRMH